MHIQIQNRLQEHLESAINAYNTDWFVICLQGSQNYDLADETSDIDSKLLTIPSFESLVLNKKPLSTTHVLENDEHCDCKDVREYFKIFRKSNINFVEILWTDYWIVNPKYADLWYELLSKREELARYNPYAAVSCMKGMASEKLHALSHRYPSRTEYIDKYGYDPKQLSHLIRIMYFIEEYLAGSSYQDCLRLTSEEKRHTLLELKRNGLGLTEDSAKELGKEAFAKISHLADKYRSVNKNNPDKELDEFLDDVVYRLMKRSVEKELTHGQEV